MSERSTRRGVPSRAAGRWPGRPRLTARLREVLRREFGAADAWVVTTPGGCRLEARFGWRIVVLLEGDEQTFWAPFYTATVRNVHRRGHLVAELAPTHRRRSELVEVLRGVCESAGVLAAGKPAMHVPSPFPRSVWQE
jgi:hypothetical protein